MTENTTLETIEYDYIVCGGGTSGSAVAARLAQFSNISVLLIEAGQDNALLENTQMVGGWSQNFDTDADWNIVTEPNTGLEGRQVKASRGKFLGGSSGCNGTLSVRGTKQDYDDWELPGWSGDDIWRCTKKAENYHPSDWMKHNPEAHGTSGPLDTEPYPLAPISNMVLDSFVSKGLPLDPDMFSSGDNPHGCGHAVRTTYQGLRVSSANYLLGAGANLTLKTETAVDRVIFSQNVTDGEIRATGVEVIDRDGKKYTFTARKEIIISGGAYCSPAILLRSGVGPKAGLEKLGIEVVVDSPGVGKNLMDHLIVFIFYELNKSGLTFDDQLYAPGALEASYKLWKEHKKGPLSAFPFGAFAYTRLDERLSDSELWKSAPRLPGRDPMGLTSKQPSIEFFTTECYGGPKQFVDFPQEGKSVFSIIPELFSPRSRGTVTLRSRDPRVNPVVNHNYLSDELDLEVLAEACRFGNEIMMEGSGTKDVVSGSWPFGATHHELQTRDEWKTFVKKHATTCYHPGGTCKMGKATDPLAVLDERLKVRGVKGLRVADTSVMPTLNQGHTQMAAYAIGERCAEIIKHEA
ncbi:alcohol oxidase [Choiromyces venosus 120613-1]|uniref:Alcohol oxidase n=1 Tax=Choiromyces venosus 120613-1 TaxID=1336337 RepID=A0A3N4JKC3_9PEZI|nr:alcohol oxidase [Choiromyces venosus 120613-1]